MMRFSEIVALCLHDDTRPDSRAAQSRPPIAFAPLSIAARRSVTRARTRRQPRSRTLGATISGRSAGGIAARASDIHIEPEEQGIGVRHRVDGVLALARTLPKTVGPALVSRIKILSGLDIADRLRPQDGRARVAVNGTAVDLRVSTLPASHGE